MLDFQRNAQPKLIGVFCFETQKKVWTSVILLILLKFHVRDEGGHFGCSKTKTPGASLVSNDDDGPKS